MSDWDTPPLTYLYPERANAGGNGYATTADMTEEDKERARLREEARERGETWVGFVPNGRRA